MNRVSERREYDLDQLLNTGEAAPHGSKKDNLSIINFINQVLIRLLIVGISQSDVKNFVGTIKEHSQKEMRNVSNTKMVNKYDFLLLFQKLTEKTGESDLFKRRILTRMSDTERNYVLTFFAAFYPFVLREIVNSQFSDFEFQSKLYEKEHLSRKLIQFIDEIQRIKKIPDLDIESKFSNFLQRNMPIPFNCPEDLFSFDFDGVGWQESDFYDDDDDDPFIYNSSEMA